MKLQWWFCWLAALLWHAGGVVVKDLDAFRSALADQQVDLIEVQFSLIDLCLPECKGANVTHSVRIAAAVPSTWRLSRQAPLQVAGNASVAVFGFALNTRNGGIDPVLSDAWQVGQNASLLFEEVTLVSPVSTPTVRRGGVRDLTGSMSAPGENRGIIEYRSGTLVTDDTGCYDAGVPVYNEASIRGALADDSVTDVTIVQNTEVTRATFPTSGLESSSSIRVADGRRVRIGGCNSVLLDINFLDRSVFFGDGSSLVLEGDIRITHVQPSLADDWGLDNFAFVGFFSISPNASAVFRNITILGDTSCPFFDSDYVEGLPGDLRPRVQELAPLVSTVSFNRTKASWVEYAHNVSSFATGFWVFENVTIAGSNERSYCNGDRLPSFTVDSGRQVLAALQEDEIHAIRITHDVALTGEDLAALGGTSLNLSRPVFIFACHPVTFDTGDLFEVVYVRTGGYLRFRGPFRFVNVHAAVRRSFNVVFLGWLSVEQNGMIELQGATVVGKEPGFTQSASHPFRGTATDALLPRGREVEIVNATHSLLVNWRLVVNDWVRTSRGIDLGETGYWQFVNVLETWEDDGSDGGGNTGAIVGGVVGATALVAAVVAGLWLWRRRRHAQSRRHRKQDLDKASGSAKAASSTATGDFSRSKNHKAEDMIMETKRAILSHQGREVDDDSIKMEAVLGQGSFGKVYRGKWRGTTVAIKSLVLPHSMTGREKLEKMAVMETAISSSLSHPNIVQTFTFGIRPLMDSSSQMNSLNANSLALEASRLKDMLMKVSNGTADPDAAVNSGSGHRAEEDSNLEVVQWELLLILEYCDCGTLRTALSTGEFNHADGSKDMQLVLHVAAGIARAMLHLHSENVIHSDLKARNVLLKSSGPDKFTPKVSDFGLSLRIDPNQSHISNMYQGTITHMAPEVLMEGRLSKAADVYAYGILLWELYTAGSAFKGLPHALLGHQVTQQGRRPDFPEACPFAYQQLACSCWDADPISRPSFRSVLEQLERMQEALQLGSNSSNWHSQLRTDATASTLWDFSSLEAVPLPTLEETLPLDDTQLHLAESGAALE